MAKTTKKVVAKKAKPAAKPKKQIQQKAKAPKQKSSGIKVLDIVHQVNPKLRLTDDAVELLNALLTEKFTKIAEAASKIVSNGLKRT